MKALSNIRAFSLYALLATLLLSGIIIGQTTEAGVALQRGYRTGYSDGYMAGYRDTIDGSARDYRRHADYAKADRAFNPDYGSREDYRDGYQQGFEAGYDTGYDRRSFESTLPANLRKRGMIDNGEPVAQSPSSAITQSQSATQSESIDTSKIEQKTYEPASYQTPAASLIIPRDIEMIVELQNDINTEQNREGDKFTARVVSPSEIAGATIEGRISKILKPGRIKRRSELALTFDRITLDDNRWSNFAASLTEVMAVKGDNIRKVDNEGTALGHSSLKNDIIKVGGATGAGAVIGGAVGGPVGVAVGAGVGAAFGVGAVVIERGKHIRLNRNQQLRIKTAYETQIR